MKLEEKIEKVKKIKREIEANNQRLEGLVAQIQNIHDQNEILTTKLEDLIDKE